MEKVTRFCLVTKHEDNWSDDLYWTIDKMFCTLEKAKNECPKLHSHQKIKSIEIWYCSNLQQYFLDSVARNIENSNDILLKEPINCDGFDTIQTTSIE
jgi:hypothetical protein